MSISLSESIASFMRDTRGRGSSARLRALLLDDAATAGRVNRAEIDAAVRAYEIGVATARPSEWTGLHERLAAEIDSTSASVALDAWSTVLSVDWRGVRPGADGEPNRGIRPMWVVAAAIGLLGLIGIVLVVANRGGDDDPANEATDPPGTTAVATSVPVTTGSETDTTTTSTTMIIEGRRSSEGLLRLDWIPGRPICEVLDESTDPIGDELFVSPDALGAIWCDFTPSRAEVALQSYDGLDKELAYDRWLEREGVERDSGGSCSEPDPVGGFQRESTFTRGGDDPVGRILCRFDPDAGPSGRAYIVWYELAYPYLGVVTSDDPEFAYSWWQNHGFETSWIPPDNDHFSDASELVGASGSVEGKTIGATRETDEPAHTGAGPHASVWWKWVAPMDGTLVMDTDGSDFDTVLSVYADSPLAELNELASDDDVADGIRTSRVELRVVRGESYRIALDGYRSGTGAYVLNWSYESSAAQLLDLDWVPDDCVDLSGGSLIDLPGDPAVSDPTAKAQVACDLTGSSGTMAAIWLYPDAATRDVAYQRRLDRLELSRDTATKCSAGIAAATEGTFTQSGEPVGRIICIPYGPLDVSAPPELDPSSGLGMIVWLETDLLYIGVVVGPDFPATLSWWADHPLNAAQPWT